MKLCLPNILENLKWFIKSLQLMIDTAAHSCCMKSYFFASFLLSTYLFYFWSIASRYLIVSDILYKNLLIVGIIFCCICLMFVRVYISSTCRSLIKEVHMCLIIQCRGNTCVSLTSYIRTYVVALFLNAFRVTFLFCHRLYFGAWRWIINAKHLLFCHRIDGTNIIVTSLYC
jgi:hypothetical protein